MNSNLQKANDLYRRSQAANGFCRAIRQNSLEQAIRLYYCEISNVRKQPEQYSSISKNLGIANLKLASLYDVKEGPKELDMKLFYLTDAVKSFSNALALKPHEYGQTWGNHIQGRLMECLQMAMISLAGDMKTDRLNKFYLSDPIFAAIGIDPDIKHPLLDIIRFDFRIGRGQFYYRCGIQHMEMNDFQTTLQLVEYAREDLELAKAAKTAIQACDLYNDVESSLVIPEMLESLARFEEDLNFLRFSCESVRARFQADEMFGLYVNDSEDLNLEMIWDILDLYKDAALKTKERDIENEAIAISRQGRLFDKIFKNSTKAHLCYRRAFDLAQTLQPRDLTTTAWYRECKRALEKFQREKVKEEEEKAEKEKAPIRKKLAKELAALKKVHEEYDSYKLLKYVYATHPPKIKYEFDESKLASETVKKYLMNALTHYHPDRQTQFDLEWQVLSEEITKCLSCRYNCMKGI